MLSTKAQRVRRVQRNAGGRKGACSGVACGVVTKPVLSQTRTFRLGPRYPARLFSVPRRPEKKLSGRPQARYSNCWFRNGLRLANRCADHPKGKALIEKRCRICLLLSLLFIKQKEERHHCHHIDHKSWKIDQGGQSSGAVTSARHGQVASATWFQSCRSTLHVFDCLQ